MTPRTPFLVPAALALLLTACAAPTAGTPSPDTPPAGHAAGHLTPPPTGTPRDYSLTVTVARGAARADIEARYGGRIVVWQPTQAFAVLGVAAPSPAGGSLEASPGVFGGSGQLATMGGSVSAWAGGSVSAWAGGSVSAWAGGTYAPVPANSGKWRRVELDRAQALATHLGAGVKVAIIDSGIDVVHPAFQGALAPAGEAWDYVGRDPLPQEEGTLGSGAYGHGTSVAGIVLQFAPRATLLPLRVLGPDGSGDVLDVAAAIDRAVTAGADIINLSLGSAEPSDAVGHAIDAAAAAGVYVVSSSGNTADQRVTFPASHANLNATAAGQFSVSVGSVDDLDHKSAFSTYGPALELVAPGEVVYGPVPGARQGAWSGTSMAAPMVSGALALALGEVRTAPGALLTDRLGGAAANIYQHEQNPGFDDLLGKGSLRLAEFLTVVMK